MESAMNYAISLVETLILELFTGQIVSNIKTLDSYAEVRFGGEIQDHDSDSQRFCAGLPV
jgi:hypothetical protein